MSEMQESLLEYSEKKKERSAVATEGETCSCIIVKRGIVVDNKILHNVDDAFIKIGYRRSLIKKAYQYADIFSPGVPVRTVGRAIFGQDPFDYRSACIGVQMAEINRPTISLVRELKALGAPQIFILNNGLTERWAITEKEPVLKDKYKTVNLPNVITQNDKEWNPQSIIRAKAGFNKPTPQQMDFVDIGLLPALEHEAANKIDYLLRAILNHAEAECKKNNKHFESSIIFKVVFRLLAAKLLKDRDVVTSSSIDFALPQTALEAVTCHYKSSLPSIDSIIPPSMLTTISQEVGSIFSLRNISVDTLTYIYENTFVSPETRQKLGIHSTPPYVADYVMSQIPIDEISRTHWHATDPMSGHGIFLIAVMRRMRDILSSDWSGTKRHSFFVEHLHGIEIDPFSVEVARMCLMLADFPEPNGWDIKRGDIFAGNTLEKAMAKTMILVGNPPFEKMEDRSPEITKPAELLQRALPALPDGAMVGLVLPRSFADSSHYINERKLVLKDFEIVSLTTLPDNIFLHSQVETMVLVARKSKSRRNVNVIYREVKDDAKKAFQMQHRVSWEDKVPQSHFEEKMKGHLFVPMMRELWKRLEKYPRLGAFAEIKKGIEYKSNIGMENVIQPRRFPGSSLGLSNAKRFSQFIAEDTVYLSTERTHSRFEESSVWNLPWSHPKVIVPTSRISAGPWRSAAIVDKNGLLATRRFYCLWPKDDSISVQTLAAILNSPIAEAFIYLHSFQRDIPKRVYADIPIAAIPIESCEVIDSLVDRYIEAAGENQSNANDILLRIDAEILKAYNLPPRFERHLLNLFWGHKRPVPFDFKGYISPELDSWIPLHIYISKQFKESTPNEIMKKLPVINDKEFLDYLKTLGREEE